ncbi:MAG: hypothetical protein D6732_11520 [Methanobacteriota archaeon]|nr:MAG: hypothetical protein D6732_11520 [Euryarchaeota archaeon]
MQLNRGLLVSCGRNLERAAASEMVHVLKEKLDMPSSKLRARPIGISGLINVRLEKSVSILETIKELIALEEDGPYFMHVLKIKPIDEVIPADLETMKEIIPKLIEGYEGSYKVVAKKRHSSLSTSIIIEAAASVVPNPVDLTNNRWELIIEVVGNKMGLAAAPKGYIYSTLKSREPPKKEDWFLEGLED